METQWQTVDPADLPHPRGGARIPEDERAAFLVGGAALAEKLRVMADHCPGRLAEAAVGREAASL